MTAIGLNTLVQLPAKAPVPEFYMPSMPPLHLFAAAGRLYRAWQYRNKLVSLLRQEPLRSQAECVGRLAELGFAVNQATLSRDLRDLGVRKGPDGYELLDAPVVEAVVEEGDRVVELSSASI